jgi:hypothetical protein
LFNDFLLRIDKDKGQILHEVSDVRAATDEVNRSKVSQQRLKNGWKYKILISFCKKGEVELVLGFLYFSSSYQLLI